jgi:hypothetical protein
MSLTKKDRTMQSVPGKDFQDGRKNPGGGRFAHEIAEALKREYLGRRGAVKLVARLTGANERAVKNWFDGKNGPSGENLVVLAEHSSQVLETFLLMAARGELVATKKLDDVRLKLKEIAVLIEEVL